MILLDTGVLFEFLADRKLAEPVARILAAGKGAVSSVTVYELFRGVQSKRHLQQRAQLLSLVHAIDLTPQIAKLAGKLYADLKASGELIDNEDILIAATSIHHAIPVFTTNRKHFARIPRVQLHTA